MDSRRQILGPSILFYGLQSPLESQVPTCEPSVQGLASLCVRELKTFFPQGPYSLWARTSKESKRWSESPLFESSTSSRS